MPPLLPLEPPLANRLPLNILVAEDDLSNQRLAEIILQKLGYAPILVSTGREAVQALHNQHFDVMILDVHMPEMDGPTTARVIATDFPPHRRPRLIALTAGSLDDRARCLNAGMNDFLAKPIEVPTIRAALERSARILKGTGRLRLPAEFIPPSAPPMDTDTMALRYVLAGEVLEARTLEMIQAHAELDVINAIIQTYLTELPRLLAKIETATRQKDARHLHFHAHRLKSSSLSLGARRVAAVCGALEKLGELAKFDDLGPHLNALYQEAELVRFALEAKVNV